MNTMQVETYEVELVPQTEMQQLASEGEHAMLVESLGLTGQKSLMGGEKLEPFPYRIMTGPEQRVFETVFPHKTKLKEFTSELIPLRVLQVAAHAIKTEFLDQGVYVWHPTDSKHDPLLVGYASVPNSTRGTRFFMLARWGVGMLPYDQLVKKAETIWSSARKVKLLAAKRVVESEIETIKANAESYFQGNTVETGIYF